MIAAAIDVPPSFFHDFPLPPVSVQGWFQIGFDMLAAGGRHLIGI